MISALSLSCPVSGLSCENACVHIATGNRVYSVDAFQDCSGKSQHVAMLPNGSAVTALLGARVLSHSSTCGEEAHSLVLVGCGDVLFAFSPGRAPLRVLHTFGARILCIHYCQETDVINLLTSLNTTFWVRGVEVWRCVESSTVPRNFSMCWHRHEGPALGIVLAADCATSSSSAELMTVKFFAGTYAGNVSEWRLCVETATLALHTHEPPVIATVVPAHRQGCALFRVKVRSFSLNGQAVECCATCSDDRTAAVFVRLTEDQHWQCWWRGSGEQFSRARVFDVELHWDSYRSALFIATAHEDGHGHVEALVVASAALTGEAPPLLFSNVQQHTRRHLVFNLLSHKGHGTYKVALVAKPLLCTEGSEVRAHETALYFLSGGFDGTVNATPLVLPPVAAAGTFSASGLDRETHFRVRVIAPDAGTTGAKAAAGHGASVRGVHTDADGCVFVLTESTALILDSISKGSTGAQTEHEDKAPYKAIGWNRSDGSPVVEGGGRRGKHGVGKDMLPARMAVFALRCAGRDSVHSMLTSYKALAVFTEGGYVILLCLQNDAAPPQCTAALQEHGKVVFVEAIERDDVSPPLLVTLHVSNQVVVSQVALGVDGIMCLKVLCQFDVGPGVRTTSLTWHGTNKTDEVDVGSAPAAPAAATLPALLLVGDKKGAVYLYNLKLHTVHVAKIFQNEPVAAIYKNGHGVREEISCVEDESFVMASDTGGYVMLTISELIRRSEACEEVSASTAARCATDVQHCLRFPFPMSSLLAATDSVWVAQLGHTVSVYERRPGQYTWHCRASYGDIKAPRLLNARVVAASMREKRPQPLAFVAHCSDGQHVEAYACRMTDALCSAGAQSQASVLLGGVIPGKDFNSIACLSDPSNRSGRNHRYALGNEDSTLTVLSFEQEESSDFPYTFAGTHHSNILCMQVLPTTTRDGRIRLVTAGGLATLAVWERVEDEVHGQGCTRGARWRILASRSEENASGDHLTEETNGSDRVARFLSLCCPYAPTSTGEKNSIVVGSSDATLRLYELKELPHAAASAVLTEEAAIILFQEEEYPKPIMALSSLECVATERSRFFIAGDTNGRLTVVEIRRQDSPVMSVRASQRTEASCVNAVSAGHLLPHCSEQEGHPATWHCVVGHDSGAVHLVEITASADTTTSWRIVVLSSHRMGITAVRGLSWKGVSAHIFALSEENVQRISCNREGTCTLALKQSVRINVRGASGFAVNDDDDDCDASGQSCVVVGQGYERVFFD